MSIFFGVQKSDFRPARVDSTDPNCHKAVFTDGSGTVELGTYGFSLDRGASGTVLKSGPGSEISIYCSILRKDEARREVYGLMTEEAPDKSGEIFDYDSSKPHVQRWVNDAIARTTGAGLPISYGNVRAQHSRTAVAGKLVSIEFDDKNKRIPIVAKIVDDDAWNKVKEGVYSGFSMGGKYIRKWQDGKYVRFTAEPGEVSLVDSPCVPGAAFTAIKSASGSGLTELQRLNRDLQEKIEALKTQITELVEKRTAANAPTRFRANPESDTPFLRQALNHPVTKSALHDTERSSFVPRSSDDPKLVGMDALNRTTEGADVASGLGKALATGTSIDPRARRS